MNEKKISTSTIAMIALMTAVTCILFLVNIIHLTIITPIFLYQIVRHDNM